MKLVIDILEGKIFYFGLWEWNLVHNNNLLIYDSWIWLVLINQFYTIMRKLYWTNFLIILMMKNFRNVFSFCKQKCLYTPWIDIIEINIFTAFFCVKKTIKLNIFSFKKTKLKKTKKKLKKQAAKNKKGWNLILNTCHI